MKFDLLIAGGEVLDPGAGLRGVMDIGIVGGRAYLRVTRADISIGELRSELLSVLHRHQQELLPEIQSVTVQN